VLVVNNITLVSESNVRHIDIISNRTLASESNVLNIDILSNRTLVSESDVLNIDIINKQLNYFTAVEYKEQLLLLVTHHFLCN
jgi:hypothetical protein